MPHDSKAGRDQIPEFQTNQPSGVNWLLVIAIDDYDPAIGKLYNCVKDVRAFMDVVTKRYHFDTQHIIPLINADATAEGIEAAFRKLLTIKPEDNLVIYYSGHGDYDDDIDLGYWIPADAKSRRQGLHNDFITRFLNRIPSRHTLLLCDSCFSGSLLLDEPTKVISPRYYTQPSRWAITSGARELVSDGKEHSPFAKALLRVLNQSTGDVDIVTLGSAIMEEVAANERQKPLFAPMRVSGHQGGMFVFFQKQNETQWWATTEGVDTAIVYYAFWHKHPESLHAEEALWRFACKQNDVAAYQLYRQHYPRGKYAHEVFDKIDDATFAQCETVKDFQNYLKTFGYNANHADEAHENMDKLLSGIVLKTPPPKIILPEESKLETPRLLFEPEMIFVPGGTFQMGSNDGKDHEKPIHEVALKDFYIGKYPVTVKEYLEFANATKSHFPEWMEEGNKYNVKTGSDGHYKSLGEALTNENHPIVGISWNDAVAYCNWLSEKTGKKYRLPTEAEWEYAARGGKQSKGFKYAGSDKLDEVGWYYENSDNKTHPVGKKKPNELGIHDMSGNVWEWCEDVWHDNYKDAPKDGSAWLSGGEQARRVVRGGSWINYGLNCRVSFRYWNSSDIRDFTFGFRLAGY